MSYKSTKKCRLLGLNKCLRPSRLDGTCGEIDHTPWASRARRLSPASLARIETPVALASRSRGGLFDLLDPCFETSGARRRVKCASHPGRAEPCQTHEVVGARQQTSLVPLVCPPGRLDQLPWVRPGPSRRRTPADRAYRKQVGRTSAGIGISSTMCSWTTRRPSGPLSDDLWRSAEPTRTRGR